MWHIESDYVIAAPLSRLTLVRTYNSSLVNPDANTVRSFGVRWTQSFDKKLEKHIQPSGSVQTCWRYVDTRIPFCEWLLTYDLKNLWPRAVSIVRSDGKRTVFNSYDRGYVAEGKTGDRVEPTFNAEGTEVLSWLYTAAAGDRQERFSGDGQLLSITERNGTTQTFTYATGASNDSSIARFPVGAPICSNVQTGAPVAEGVFVDRIDYCRFRSRWTAVLV